MRITFRHSISYCLTALILFSTIGINIIVSFCQGCESEHINFALIANTSDECSCCANNDNTIHCCGTETKHTKEHHQKKNFWVQIKYDSTEAKGKVLKTIIPVVTFFSVAQIVANHEVVKNTPALFPGALSPPVTGRIILLSSCILRI